MKTIQPKQNNFQFSKDDYISRFVGAVVCLATIEVFIIALCVFGGAR